MVSFSGAPKQPFRRPQGQPGSKYEDARLTGKTDEERRIAKRTKQYVTGNRKRIKDLYSEVMDGERETKGAGYLSQLAKNTSDTYDELRGAMAALEEQKREGETPSQIEKECKEMFVQILQAHTKLKEELKERGLA